MPSRHGGVAQGKGGLAAARLPGQQMQSRAPATHVVVEELKGRWDDFRGLGFTNVAISEDRKICFSSGAWPIRQRDAGFAVESGRWSLARALTFCFGIHGVVHQALHSAGRSTDCQAVYEQGRLAHAHGHALSRLAAGTNAGGSSNVGT